MRSRAGYRRSRSPAMRCAVTVACATLFGTWIMPAGAHMALKSVVGPGIVDRMSRFPVYRDLGARIYEDHLWWNQVAPSRPRHQTDPNDPAYVWPAEITAAVAHARRYHMQVALQIIGSPAWANGGHPWNWAPSDPRDFAEFAAAAARRYRYVHMWMIWVEPQRRDNFNPLTGAPRGARLDAAQKVAPHNYARLLDAAYSALKHVSRANLVIGGMTYTTGEISPQQWIENLRLPDGRPPRMDMYGHNPFSWRDPSLSNPPLGEENYDFSDLARLTKLVERNLGRPRHKHLKLFLTEWTIPTKVGQDFNFYVDPLVQAQWITDSLRVANQLSSVYAVGWIHVFDEPPGSYGGLLEADGVKKPGYYAWKDG